MGVSSESKGEGAVKYEGSLNAMDRGDLKFHAPIKIQWNSD